MLVFYTNTLSALYSLEADLESASLQFKATKAEKFILRRKLNSYIGLNKEYTILIKTINLIELKEKVTTANLSLAKFKRK